jgi:adenine specific DNA methylase Mod
MEHNLEDVQNFMIFRVEIIFLFLILKQVISVQAERNENENIKILLNHFILFELPNFSTILN